MNYQYFCSLILIYLFGACSTQQNQENSLNFIAKKFPELAVKTDTFTFMPNQAKTLSTKNSRHILIKENSFIYQDGTPVTEPILIEIREFDTLADIIAEGLQTQSTEGVLETAGMFQVSAKTNSNKKIKINPKFPLELQTLISKQQSNNKAFDLYNGKKTENGIRWNSPSRANQLGPIPFDLIYSNDEHKRYDYRKYFFKNTDLVKYQNTWIATPGFFERVEDYSSFHSQNEDSTIQLFLTMADFPIRKVDSLVVDLLRKDSIDLMKKTPLNEWDIKAITDKIQFYTNKYLNTLNRGIVIHSSQKLSVDTLLLLEIQENEYPYYNLGNKKSEEEFKIMLANQDLYNTTYIARCNARFTGENPALYLIYDLGWHNIDRLLEENYEMQSIEVKVENAKSQTSFFLLLKNKKVVINTMSKTNSSLFNTRLPKESAYLLALSIENRELLFGYKEIKIGQNKKETLKIYPCLPSKFKSVIDSISLQ
jgi:hypothetical protein